MFSELVMLDLICPILGGMYLLFRKLGEGHGLSSRKRVKHTKAASSLLCR